MGILKSLMSSMPTSQSGWKKDTRDAFIKTFQDNIDELINDVIHTPTDKNTLFNLGSFAWGLPKETFNGVSFDHKVMLLQAWEEHVGYPGFGDLSSKIIQSSDEPVLQHFLVNSKNKSEACSLLNSIVSSTNISSLSEKGFVDALLMFGEDVLLRHVIDQASIMPDVSHLHQIIDVVGDHMKAKTILTDNHYIRNQHVASYLYNMNFLSKSLYMYDDPTGNIQKTHNKLKTAYSDELYKGVERELLVQKWMSFLLREKMGSSGLLDDMKKSFIFQHIYKDSAFNTNRLSVIEHCLLQQKTNQAAIELLVNELHIDDFSKNSHTAKSLADVVMFKEFPHFQALWLKSHLQERIEGSGQRLSDKRKM